MEDKIVQTIVMRKDLKMRRGKEIAQGAHASMLFMVRRLKEIRNLAGNRLVGAFSSEEKEWMSSKFTKITLQVDSEEMLDLIYKEACERGLTVHMVTDSGLTEFGGVPTKTCLAIGPNRKSEIDLITKDLRLY